ncbi:Origin of replication complex subunit [Sesamum angolense]|uniref:Origin of replication complex subunit n=1 Tax=Sesamum angolense TaxID=2727404 RepID=A0AAE1X0Q8_9LAMI|nr:Origin of replication complex subunit [Sesamum angolense]
MDMSEIAKKLGISESKQLIRKAAELRRLADIQFDSSVIGVGEICKAIICLEIAASRMEVIFDRQTAIRLSGMSEKAYNRSFNSMQNGIGVKFKDRFLASLPPSRKGSTDFSRPVFTAVAFYLCAKKQKLKVDKFKLIELAGTSESEFSSVSTSMLELCFDVFGIAKEKKDSKKIKGNRVDEFLLLFALCMQSFLMHYLKKGGLRTVAFVPMMARSRLSFYAKLYIIFLQPSAYKKRKQTERHGFDEWKSAVLKSNKRSKTEAPAMRTKTRQSTLDFLKRVPQMSSGKKILLLNFLLGVNESSSSRVFGELELELDELIQIELELETYVMSSSSSSSSSCRA